MSSQSEIINLTSLLDFSNKLTQNLSEEFIVNSTLLTLIGKLGICGIKVTKSSNDIELATYNKGRLQCNVQITENITIAGNINYQFQLGEKIVETEISDLEKQYVKLIISIASTALENYYNFEKLQTQKIQAEKKSQLLETLFEISRSFSGLTSEEKIVKAIAFNIMGQLTTNKFAIVKLDKSLRILKNNLGISDIELIEIVHSMDKIQLDTDFSAKYKDVVRIATPMTISGNTEGYILIGKKMHGQYDEQDYSFVSSLAATAISALENERLIIEEIENKRYESEMSLAINIQKRLLPRNSLEHEKFSYYGMTVPSNEVGGDYFDYVKISPTKYLFVIADVTGKGMPAALIMSNIQAAIQALAPIEKDLKALVNTVNKIVYKNTSKDIFITAFFCLFDTEKDEMEYINAGHFYPLMSENNTLQELKVGGVILGFLPSPLIYKSETIKFGDALIMYTDGLNEATDEKGNELGMEGVKRIATEAVKLPSKEAALFILDKAREYSGGDQLSDDISIVVLKRK